MYQSKTKIMQKGYGLSLNLGNNQRKKKYFHMKTVQL